jgi:hypothetical protein
MENWNENDSLDYFIEALEAISEDIKTLTAYENLCENEDGKKCNLNVFFITLHFLILPRQVLRTYYTIFSEYCQYHKKKSQHLPTKTLQNISIQCAQHMLIT